MEGKFDQRREHAYITPVCKYALVIGVSDYTLIPGKSSLPKSVKDA
jgi:hypothetical protein